MFYYVLVLSIIIGFYGLFVGSFLNVCIYRIPLKESIVTTSSHCTSCSHKLAWYDLFPLFSYLFLGGKCRYCKAHISAQYPFVEALNAIIWFSSTWLVFYNLNYSINLQGIITCIIYCLFFSALIVLSGIDIKYQVVHDRVNIFIFILGVILLITDYTNWASHLIGFFAVSLPLFILMIFGGMGGGDVKLYAAAGFLMGWKVALISLVLACFIGSVFGLVIAIPYWAKKTKPPAIPFVPYIAAGMFISVFWSDWLINWYITTFLSNII